MSESAPPSGGRAAELRLRLEKRMAELSAAQRNGLDQVVASLTTEEEAIRPRPPGAEVPLTPQQELLWIFDRASPGLAAYNLPRVYRFDGCLDLGALQRGLDTLVARHEILRTAFVVRNGKPVQEVRAAAPVPIEVDDLRSVALAEREAAATSAMKAFIRGPIALDGGLLLRGRVIRLADAEHIVVLLTHHIASDGWSRHIMEQELQAVYDALVAGGEPALPALRLQFGDYAVWQAARLAGEGQQRTLDYWRSQLALAPPPLELPTERPHSGAPRFEGAWYSRALVPETGALLTEQAVRLGASRFMVLLAAFHALLARYTGQEDTLVAIPMAARHRAELESMMGYLVNTLPIRARPRRDATFAMLVDEVRQACLGAHEHPDVSFEQLAAIAEEEEGGRPLQLQTSFTLAGGDGAAPFRLAGLIPKPVGFDPGWAKFELSLTMMDGSEGLRGGIEYRTDLFSEETANRVLEHYETLLTAALRNPNAPLGTLPLMSDAERRKVLYDWNATEAPVPERRVHQLVADRARLAPDATAVLLEERRLTYGELDARAEILARHLRRLGVGPEVRVGVCFEASLDLPVSILGVLKAGGACLPLDPGYPEERLGFMIADAQAAVILTCESLAADLPAGDARIVLVDRDWPIISAAAPAPAPGEPSADGAAYVLYTSGSTGPPRGVVLTHRGMVNHALYVVGRFALRPSDRMPQIASLSFDISMEEIFSTLIAGATLVLRPRELPLLGRAFEQWLTERGATVLDLATAYWHEWTKSMAERGDRVPACIRLIVVGGEKALASVYQLWREVAHPGVRLINSYGPTETTCIVTTWEPPDDPADLSGGDFPLGRPIANTRIYILDPLRQPVPVGLRGELHIAGVPVARGYLNQPELTSAKFFPDPFHPGTGERVYATGDRARFRSDGTIEFLGRIDHQVKIRGFRVELGEVETALARCEGVREAVAIMREDAPGAKRLVGYYVPSGPDPGELELRRALLRALPEYMVPAALVQLAALPLSPNGKLDRRKLPAPVPEEAGAAEEPVELSTLRTAILRTWQGLFPGRRIGIHDDFFELGGHSLLAARLVDALQRGTGFTLPITALFEGATIAQLEQYLLRHTDGSATPDIVELRAGNGGPVFFLLHGDMTGGGFYAREIANAFEPGQGFYTIPPMASPDVYYTPTIEEMAEHHLHAVRRVQPRGPYWLGGYCVGGLVALEMARRLRAAGEAVDLLMAIDTSVYNAHFRLSWLLANAMAHLTRSTPARRVALRGYLMARLYRIRQLPPGKRLLYLAAFPFRYLGRKLERRRPHAATRTTEAPKTPWVAPLHQILVHHERAMMAYMPARYDGRVDLIRAIPEGSAERDPTRGWCRVARHLVPVYVIQSHHGLLFNELPELVRAALARIKGSARP